MAIIRGFEEYNLEVLENKLENADEHIKKYVSSLVESGVIKKQPPKLYPKLVASGLINWLHYKQGSSQEAKDFAIKYWSRMVKQNMVYDNYVDSIKFINFFMTEWDLLPEPPHLSQEWENFSEEWAQIAKSQKEQSSSFDGVPTLYKAEYCIEGFCETFMFEINKADAAEPIKDNVNKARVEIINPATTYKIPEFKMLKHRLHEVHYKVIEENVKHIIKQLKPPTILLGRYRCYKLQPGNIIDGDNVTYSEFCQMDHWKIKGYPTLWIRGTWLLTK